ncbi:c-type cytochrome [Undibacterium fentianense]|uniref:C-type cytochrome n=1 Tax=Undibacterium fentianense TaxID=2828728 RepID=A0A941IG32_9BURK|nr:c-type cytochrome [Undibacterium fentianense]MBR7801376.1 c-type cytochrome [Undibacterium fentianense]
MLLTTQYDHIGDASPSSLRYVKFWRIVACFAALILCQFSSAQKIPDTLEQRLKACTACHGAEGRATSDGYYPRIAGKPSGYLLNQLRHFRDEKRSYPMMTYMLSHLNESYLSEIADYFSKLNPPYAAPQPTPASVAELKRGESLVKLGDRVKKIPACVACHGELMTGLAPFVPGLLGLPRDYLVAQLGAWQTGNRHASSPDCMQSIARQLDAGDIAAVSAWLANQTIPVQSKAMTATKDQQFPMRCGSIQP